MEEIGAGWPATTLLHACHFIDLARYVDFYQGIETILSPANIQRSAANSLDDALSFPKLYCYIKLIIHPENIKVMQKNFQLKLFWG